jgi:hypothetical protein
MKNYKWLRGLLKASALTTVMFIMQACYGVPKNLEDVVENHEDEDTLANYQHFDTLVYSDTDLTDLKIKLESNQ